jgi:alpha-amylase
MISQEDVLYMIVTDRFADGDPTNNGGVDRSAPGKRHGGDLRGIIQRLRYLRALGATALWITPVYPNPLDAYHGYHPLGFEKVDPHLCSPELGHIGSRETLRRFVEIAHDHGLKVIFDAIICHTAPGHPWLKERSDWYNENIPTPEKWWIWGLPDLNHDNVNVNFYFAQNVLDWVIDSGVDGVRIDAARHVEKQFWSVCKLFLKGLRPDVSLIGEVWDTEVAVVAPYQAYHGFDSMFDYPLYHAVVDVFTDDQGFNRIARPELSENEWPGILNHDTDYRNAYHLITFLENHDTPRFLHLAGSEERPAEALLRTKLALTFLFTTRGIPQLYYGSELAMDGGSDPDNRRDMAWSLVDGSGTGSAEVERAQAMYAFCSQLIHLRRSSMALRYGLLTTLYVTPTVYAFARTFPGDVRLVVLNNSHEPIDVAIPVHANPRLPAFARCCLRDGTHLHSELVPTASTRVSQGTVRVQLAGRSGVVYRSDPSPSLLSCPEAVCFCDRIPNNADRIELAPTRSQPVCVRGD